MKKHLFALSLATAFVGVAEANSSLYINTPNCAIDIIVTDQPADDDDTVYDAVEVMPKFPGDIFQWLGAQIKYPATAQAQGIQGRVITSFVVAHDGSLTDIKIIRAPHLSLAEEARRVLKLMPKWEPGYQGGKAVNVKYTLPIMFKLDNPKDAIVTDQPADDDDTVYDIAEVNPKFPGDTFQWIGEHIKYPATAQAQGIQGRVITSFVVECDGSLSNIKVIRAPHPSLAEETVRVLKLMPKWEPGYQGGKAVRVKYSLPVLFKLNSPKK